MASWEEYLQNQIQNDGIHMTWNVLPHSRVDAQKLIVPAATFFTPLKVISLRSIVYKTANKHSRKDQQNIPNNQCSNMIQYSVKNQIVKLS
jgi:hypothetical protein